MQNNTAIMMELYVCVYLYFITAEAFTCSRVNIASYKCSRSQIIILQSFLVQCMDLLFQLLCYIVCQLISREKSRFFKGHFIRTVLAGYIILL